MDELTAILWHLATSRLRLSLREVDGMFPGGFDRLLFLMRDDQRADLHMDGFHFEVTFADGLVPTIDATVVASRPAYYLTPVDTLSRGEILALLEVAHTGDPCVVCNTAVCWCDDTWSTANEVAKLTDALNNLP